MTFITKAIISLRKRVRKRELLFYTLFQSKAVFLLFQVWEYTTNTYGKNCGIRTEIFSLWSCQGVEQPPERTEKSFSFQGLREAYPHLDWPKMQLCCMPQLTCFYNPASFTFAFKMFILISNYVYCMLQPPLFSLFYFMFYTYPTFCLFLCQGQICF